MKKTYVGLILMLALVVLAYVSIAANYWTRHVPASLNSYWPAVVVGSTTVNAQTFYQLDHQTYHVFYRYTTGLAVDYKLIGIDLDNSKGGYKHPTTGSAILLKGWDITYCLNHEATQAMGEWDTHLGVITRTGATNGDMYYISNGTINNADWSFGAYYYWGNNYVCNSIHYTCGDGKMDLSLDGATLEYVTTTVGSTNDTNLDNDETLGALSGDTIVPALGDVVIFFDEIRDGTTAVIKNLNISYQIKP